MLNRADKEALVDGLKKDIEGARAVFLTNLIGIPSNDSVGIRKQIREAAGKVVVTRNTLFTRAAVGTYAEKLLAELKGPHALAFAFEDAPAVAKALKKAAEDFDVVEFKGGFLNGEELSIADIKALADLPSRDEMLGTLLATMNAPVSAFARLMNQLKEKVEAGESITPGAGAPAAAEEAVAETTEE
ncbi:MAG: 50S ribosomal protein L10 [Deltaproteobacteria bacterium]|nr:MAG: 50S ribosomal protein L10 [Deltaproteobacteria bacterium]TNF28039.1 MAG: 50S ribosomal protein L10 [Deltaproteobacteria bacterium]